MNAIQIDDPDDERVEPYRSIRERDLVGRGGRFIAEGKVVLQILLRSEDYLPESVLLLRRRLPAMADLLATRPGIPVYVAEDAVMESIAGFHVHRGILALGRRRDVSTPVSLLHDLPDRALVVVCVGISNHDNIGSIFRNAAAFGCGAVLLDATCCDPLYRKSLRVSVGGVLKVPFARFADLAEARGKLAAADFREFALSPRGGTDISRIPPGGRTAIYLGSEGAGLPHEIMRGIPTVRIPISSDFDSLNVAAASAIALHRLTG